MSKEKMDVILSAIPWRCFHCDFITNDPTEAEAHFGDRDDAEEFKPICKWWDRTGEDERISILQGYIRDIRSEQEENHKRRIEIEGLEYQLQPHRSVFKGYKPFRDCCSVHDVFCVYDSMEGRALAAEEKVNNLTGALRDAVERIKGREYTADLLSMADTGGIA